MRPGYTEELIIIGAGGTSRDIAWAVEEINEITPRWNILGFLDDDPAKAGDKIHGYPVLGAIDRVSFYPSARLIVGVASYRNQGVRKKIVEQLNFAPERYATVIAPSARVSRSVRIGVGSAVLQCAVVSPDAVIGDHTLLTQSCVICHNAVLSDYSTLAVHVTVCGSARLDEGVYAGAGSTIRDGITVGCGAVVGMGAVVVSDIAPRDLVAGNPARSLLDRAKAER